MHKPYGKGLSGFVFGLLLATLIIGALLFLLNHSSSGFRQPNPPPEVEIQPEILTPRGSQQGSTASEVAQQGNGSADPRGDFPDASNDEPVPPVAVSEPKPSAETVKTELPKPEPKPRETVDVKPPPAEPKPREQPRTEPKPTPEQILNSGNVERAREQARREQQAETRRNNNNQQAGNNRAAESQPAPAQGGRVVVQMGSFNSAEAADTQRAKLAMLGVNARVSQSTGANGQTVYRIQSGRMSRSEAQALTEKLRSNNIDSLTRSAD